MNHQKLVDENIRIHDRIARRYEKDHSEIFNDIEQQRLHETLKQAALFINSESKELRALDFGCGSGNLTSHLLGLHFHVTAADISAEFLRLVSHRHGAGHLDTIRLNGNDLENISSNHFDFIAMYSVLHHIPDYLGALRELAVKCKKGGVIYIDHERNPQFWKDATIYNQFVAAASRHNWRKYFHLPNYIHKIKRLKNPKHTNEGDIHVWPDDHIEWELIEQTFHNLGFETVLSQDYLHYNKLYREEVYQSYLGKCTDMRTMAFRKK